MTPSEIACRRCASQPGEPCCEAAGAVALSIPFHAERIEDAAGFADNGGIVATTEQWKKAVLATGDV